jgi:hypothetical protein
MRCCISLLLPILVFPLASFSGTKQLEDRPPTASYSKREPAKIRLSDFDENPFSYDITADLLLSKLSKKFKVFKEIVKNTHNPQIKDTIFHFSCQTTKLKIYKSLGSEILFFAQISDNEIGMRNQIKIGMSREAFFDKFVELEKYRFFQGVTQIEGDDEMSSYRLIIQPNMVKLRNLLGTSDYVFIFTNNLLSQVNMNVYMD